MPKIVIHWAPRGLYTLCGSGGYCRLAFHKRQVTCKNCLKKLRAKPSPRKYAK